MVSILNTVASLCLCGSGRFARVRVGTTRWVSFMTTTTTGGGEPNVDELDSDWKNWLVVGDGDLSYSSTIAENFANSNIRLTATVLEEEEVHNRVYERSKENTLSIASHPSHAVQFEIDATKLESSFTETRFDFIQFNFPHWRGKTNAKRNRILLDSFLQSATNVLKPTGEIQVALCDGQGGMPADTLEEWRKSWLGPMYAAEHGLLLTRLEAYEPEYGLSSHRGADRPFFLGDRPQKYVYQFPQGTSIPEDLQISCRHELRVMLDPEKLESSPKTVDDIVHGGAVFELCQRFIPDGIRFEIPAQHLMTPSELKGRHVPLAVFLLNYSGENVPLTRQAADQIRDQIEKSITANWGLDIAKSGRLVSRPYPHMLLPKLIREYS